MSVFRDSFYPLYGKQRMSKIAFIPGMEIDVKLIVDIDVLNNEVVFMIVEAFELNDNRSKWLQIIIVGNFAQSKRKSQ